jgi:hypothetical protein
MVAVAGGLLLLPGVSLAQEPRDKEGDLIDQVRRREQVAAQKAEFEMRQALRRAEQVGETSPRKAIDRLQKAVAVLDEDTRLTPERRASLKRLFQARIKDFESGATPSAAMNEKQAQAALRQVKEDQARVKHREISTKLDSIDNLHKQGKTEEAARQAGELGKNNPDNVPVRAAERRAISADEIAKERQVRQDKARGFLAANRDIDKSAVPTDKDIEYPKDWKERTKNRTAAIKLTAKERAILTALKAPITVNFKNWKFDDVITYLETSLGQTILVDREALKDAEVAYDTPINLNVKNVSARTVLRIVLAQVGLTYIVKDELIQVISKERAKDMMVVRTYYIGDIILNMDPAQAMLPLLQQQQIQGIEALKNVKQIIDMIQSSVDPQSWQLNGGNGTISFDARSMSLVIRQSAEVHAMLGSGGLLR